MPLPRVWVSSYHQGPREASMLVWKTWIALTETFFLDAQRTMCIQPLGERLTSERRQRAQKTSERGQARTRPGLRRFAGSNCCRIWDGVFAPFLSSSSSSSPLLLSSAAVRFRESSVAQLERRRMRRSTRRSSSRRSCQAGVPHRRRASTLIHVIHHPCRTISLGAWKREQGWRPR